MLAFHIPVHQYIFLFHFPQFFKVKFDMLASHIPVHLVLEAKVELLVAPAHSIFISTASGALVVGGVRDIYSMIRR